MLDRAHIMEEIDGVMDRYCDNCLVKKALNQERGKTAAHRFCIEECTIGDQLKFLGDEMNKVNG